MITQKIKPAMHPVNQPALHLRAAYWTSLEKFLRAASRVAAEQQAAAQTKEVAL